MADLSKRLFYLKNNKNEIYDLLKNVNNSGWLYQPDGLGFEKSIETATLLNRRIILSVKNEFPEISGSMFFDNYNDYKNFEEYVERSQINSDLNDPNNYLKLYYETQDNVNKIGYYKVYINLLEKSEKDLDGLLICNINFQRLSNYLIDEVVTTSNELNLQNNPTFPLGVGTPFIRFGSGFSSVITFEINNTSYIDIPVKFEIDGGFNDPTFENLTNGIKGGYFINATTGSLIVEANTPQYIKNGGVSVAQQQDMTKINFLILSPGNNTIKFDLGQTNTFGAVTIFYTKERLSV